MARVNAQEIGWHAAGNGGAVAAGGAQAVGPGIELLQQGGNAADAAVATILALSVTDYGLFSIGGEVPFMIYDARAEEVKVLSGQGRAPLSQAAIDWYMEHGIPTDGDLKAAAVPAAIDLCVTALKLYGTKTFEAASGPMLALLDAGGLDWHPLLATTMRRLVETERRCAGTREAKLQAVSDRFYRGDIADELEAFYVAKGSFMRKQDLAAHVTSVEDPVTVQYRGYTVCKCGTWTQGPYLCQALRLLEGFDLQRMGHLSADYVHVVTEAIKLAMADRDEYYGDPLFADVPLLALLSDPYTEVRRPLIDMRHASAEARPGDPYAMRALKGGGQYRPNPGGTTTCVVADRWGNVVAATPSCNFYGGQENIAPNGVAHGTRLTSLNTTKGHPNCVQPGKRPRITLTPTLVLQQGQPVLAISVAGGDLQDQTTLNALLNRVEFGMLPQAAVTAPRFATAHHQDSFDPNPVRTETFGPAATVTVNHGVSQDVRDELASRGHQVIPIDGHIATPVMLYLDRDSGTVYAAGDPTAGRHAAAI
jgi:gamma-glutamyltranspeptidase/glutathione hydrolase